MTKKTFPEDPIELKGFLERLGLWNDTTQAIYLDLITQPNNKKLYEEYQAILMPDVFERLEKFSPFSSADEKVDASIRFATTEQGKHVGIDPHECHMLLAGQTGCGKSTLLRLMFSNALQLKEYQTAESSEKIICWLFAKAQDMRSLLNVNKDILIVTFNEIKLNPLEPPVGMKSTDWASIFADLWIQA
ncbi:hypothetical protein JXA85_00375, partial [Candidatus Woesearchaeota archaeon]|nr:hypothetical protein [Candidatus Woesearchaeota archaeon]